MSSVNHDSISYLTVNLVAIHRRGFIKRCLWYLCNEKSRRVDGPFMCDYSQKIID